jgi:uncharacterized protein YjbI with pentapeptide repeats
MYTLNKCLVRSCRNLALSTFDENGNITENKNYCLDHIPDPGKIKEQIYNYINTHDKIIGLNTAGITFTDINLTNKRFYGCNFQHCTFINLHSEGFRSRMSMFDFAVFSDCNLLNCNMQFTSFAGCTFSHTLFTGSDMIQNNFNGVQAYQSSFDDSDLYNSRFIHAKLVNTSFRDCNVKKTIFCEIEQENVSFKMSNTREAVFDRRGSALFLGSDETRGTIF